MPRDGPVHLRRRSGFEQLFWARALEAQLGHHAVHEPVILPALRGLLPRVRRVEFITSLVREVNSHAGAAAVV